MGQRFDTQPDKGKNMEVAMAATMFRDLQDAGYIKKDAKLATKLPSHSSLSGKTYEARLVELIKDRDKNGKLDIDLSALKSSGMLQGSPSTDQLEGTLGGTPRARLSDSFIQKQDDKSQLNGLKFQRGQKVQRLSAGMVLSANQDRATAKFADSVSGRVSKGEGSKVAQEALNSAQVLQAKSPRQAQELLLKTSDALVSAGARGDAKKLYERLKQPPYKDTKINLVQKYTDQSIRSGRTEKLRYTVKRNRKTKTTIDSADHRKTVGELADRKLSQIDQHDRMEKVLGRKVDPHKYSDVTAYFDKFAKGKSTGQVRGEYEKYLKNFYVHSGEGVTWNNVPADQRPAKLQDVMEGQPKDAAGRKLIDCEGYTYLTDRILGSVKDGKGNKRFDVQYAGKDTHVISSVVDKGSREAFLVNNSNTKPLGKLKDQAQLRQILGNELAKGVYDLVGWGPKPSDSIVQKNGIPKVGAVIWSGSRATGTVDDEFAQSYRKLKESHSQPGLTISNYIWQRATKKP